MFVLGLAVGAGPVGPGGLGAQGEASLAVMSFNFRYATAPDGDNSWDHRKGVFANAIRACAPDVFGAQECLESQAEFVVQTLPEYHWFGIGRESNGEGEMAAVFYKKKTLSPIETGNFWLSETPDVPGSKSWKSACTRMVTWAKFRHLQSGQLFYFFNTHFDHASEQARQQAARLLLERIKALSGDLPVILTGDFNAAAEEAVAWKTLGDGGFSDAWLTAEKKVGPDITYGGFKPPVEGKKDRIDWILTRGPIKVQQCETVLYSENGRYPSDHYPVTACLRLFTEYLK